MTIFGAIKDIARKEILNQKPKRIVKCPECKTNIPSWEMGEKTCPYCKTRFEA